MKTELVDEISQALVGDVEPARLDAFRFATGILPAFRLIRSLFSQNEVDTCLKLMVLHELSRAGGRSTLERVRTLVGFLDPGRVDSIVRSLREGGWLDLRGSDNTYTPSIAGMNLLALLSGADLGSVSPTNVLARAATTAKFNAELQGAASAVGLLLDQLNVLLDDEVEQARHVLRLGRPHRMIAWSRRQHARQLETIRGVLDHLQEQLDAASREFGRVVRLHETMQDLVQMHAGIHTRLRDWNLERLHTTDAGYSIPQLVEAILGAEDEALLGTIEHGIVTPLVRAPSLTVDEIRARFHAARRRLPSQLESFSYAPPEPSVAAPWAPAEVDHVAALRARLTELLGERTSEDAPLELEDWLDAQDFPEAAWALLTVARLEASGATLLLDDGRQATLHLAIATPEDVPSELPGQALTDWLVKAGRLRALPAGDLARVRVSLVAPAGEGS